MTNQEAIEAIKLARSQVEWDYPMDYAAAFDKAIEALEQEPVVRDNGVKTELNRVKDELGVTSELEKNSQKLEKDFGELDCISRADALDCVNWGYTFSGIYKAINELPPVTPHPRKGHWIRVTDKAGHLVWECDKCGWQQRFNTNYCPDCNADMRG